VITDTFYLSLSSEQNSILKDIIASMMLISHSLFILLRFTPKAFRLWAVYCSLSWKRYYNMVNK